MRGAVLGSTAFEHFSSAMFVGGAVARVRAEAEGVAARGADAGGVACPAGASVVGAAGCAGAEGGAAAAGGVRDAGAAGAV